MLFSNFLATNSRATCVRYIRVIKLMMKKQGLLLLLEILDKDALEAKTVGITDLDEPSLYVSFEKDTFLII